MMKVGGKGIVIVVLLLVIGNIMMVGQTNDYPEWLPEIQITINNQPSEGFYFLGVVKPPDSNQRNRGILLMLDTTGQPVFYQRLFDSNPWDFKLNANDKLSYLSGNTNTFIELDAQFKEVRELKVQNGYYTDAHDCIILEDDSYWLMGLDPQIIDMSQIITGGNPEAIVVGAVIQHIDPNENVLFEWRSFDHMDILECDTNFVDLTQVTIDLVHPNAIDLDNDGNILLSSRHHNEITKINTQNGDIIWRWGGNANEFTFLNDTLGFGGQHSIRYNDDNTFTLFNNGNYQQNPARSFGVEYSLDQNNMTATLTNIYDLEDSLIYSSSMGHLQRLDNGHTIIGWSNNAYSLVFSEYDEKQQRVFEIISPDHGLLTYRVFKYDWQCGIFDFAADSLAFDEVIVGSSHCIDVEVTNNLNTALVINDHRIINDHFSLLTSLPISIPAGGSHNITLCFEPQEAQEYTGVLNLEHKTDTSMISRQLKLVGTGIPVGSQELEPMSQEIQVYPNPTNGSCMIKLSPNTHIESLYVSDISGKIIFSIQEIYQSETKLQLSGFKKGIYLITVKNKAGIFNSKLLVK